MVTNKAKLVRDSDAMRARILEALGSLILSEGLEGVGVNALARAAGCDKVLVYRYFGDLDGVYAAFAASRDFWWSLDELTQGLDAKGLTLAAALTILLRRHAASLRSRAVTLAVLASELTHRTPLVIALETVRERRSLELLAWIQARFSLPVGIDLEAIAMLIGVAINYLAVRAKRIRVMSGVPIQTDADWERIFAAVDGIVDAVLRNA
jgi:AcrR family transcriptional regulator